MGLKTVAQQIADEEQGRSSGHKHQVKKHSGGGGSNPVFTLLAIGLVLFAGFMFLQMFVAPYQYNVLPFQPAGLEGRATNYAFQQDQLRWQMTAVAATSTAFESGMIQSTQASQWTHVASTQAQESANQARASATAWSLTQTPMAEEQLKRDIRMQEMQRDAYWRQFISPLKVIGGAGLVGAILLAMFAGAVYAFLRLLPMVQARMSVHTQSAHEKIVIVKPDETTVPDLMFHPVIKHNPDGTLSTGGGADDPLLQAGLASQRAKVDAIKGLPPGARLPGEKPPDKLLPQIEVVDAQVTDQNLLLAARNSVEGEEV